MICAESPQEEFSRFWSKVNMGPECWDWTGAMGPYGYGTFWDAGKRQGKRTKRAHRVAWVHVYGDIPKGLLICHRCDNRRCVRPDHLFLGTHRDNTEDMVAKGRFVLGRRSHGELNGSSKLVADQVMAIRRRYTRGEEGKAMAEEFGICQAHVSRIVLRKTWKHLPPEPVA
jgi:hypothetical protein